MGGLVPLSSLKLHLIWGGQPWASTLQTWILKSAVWSHTYFLEFGQAVCRQKPVICIKYRLHASFMWIEKVSSPCRAAASSSSAELRDAERAGSQSRSVKLDLLALKTKTQAGSAHPIEKQQQRAKPAAAALEASWWVLEVLDVLWGGFVIVLPLIPAVSSHAWEEEAVLVPLSRRTWGTDVSLFSPSKRLIVSCHAGWLLLSSGLNTHTLTHTSFYEWKCSSLPNKHFKAVKCIHLLQLCNPNGGFNRFQQCLQTNETACVYVSNVCAAESSFNAHTRRTVLKCKGQRENISTKTRKQVPLQDITGAEWF